MHYLYGQPDPVDTDPVLVHTLGKVGSTSVAASLESRLRDREVCHVHWLDPRNIRRDEGLHRARARRHRGRPEMQRLLPKYAWLGARLSSAISKAGDSVTWDVVTLVRDPIPRNVSSFFQNLETLFDVWPAKELVKRSVDDVASGLVELFLRSYVEDSPTTSGDADPLTWFDEEFAPVWHVDVFREPFPAEPGFVEIEAPNARVLLLRLEDLDRVAGAAFARFLGLEDFAISRSNVAADKEYAALYARFKERLALPPEYVDRVYSSRYATHFYTAEELDGMRRRWRTDVPGSA
jgi:hypothetical protein